ncbi:type-1 angiotensin II receptor isoform X2 [Amia ocellicauda]
MVGLSPGGSQWDPRSTLRRYLLLKYLQVLVLPSGNTLVSSLGMLGSMCAALLLRLPSVSRKASTVLLSQLAWADGLVLLCRGLAALPVAMEGLGQGLLAANGHASLLFLSCLSLEALLVTLCPVESRGLRTASFARLASTVIWVAVLGELAVLQAADYHGDELGPTSLPGEASHLAKLVFQVCQQVAPLLRILSHGLGAALWLINAYVHYTVFYHAPLRRTCSFH